MICPNQVKFTGTVLSFLGTVISGSAGFGAPAEVGVSFANVGQVLNVPLATPRIVPDWTPSVETVTSRSFSLTEELPEIPATPWV